VTRGSSERRTPKEPLSHDRSATAWVGGMILLAAVVIGAGGGLAIALVILGMMRGQ